MPARLLAEDDTLLGADETLTVIANDGEAHPQGVTVYNLEVEQAHTYFVIPEDAGDAAAVWVHNAVKAYETGTYGELRARSKPRDGLSLDHQPSKAALLEAAERELRRPLTAAEARAVIDGGAAVAVPTRLHYRSRTYGGNNTAVRITGDSLDFISAVRQDTSTMIRNASAANKSAARAAALDMLRRAGL